MDSLVAPGIGNDGVGLGHPNHGPRSVCVIVPVKNSPTLIRCLGSLTESSQTPERVIVVDASTTPAEIPEGVARQLRLTLRHERTSQLQAKALGASLANEDLVLFLDADQWASPGLVAELSLSSSEMVAVQERAVGSGLVPKLITLSGHFLWHKFREFPDLGVPVIPRIYSRELLQAGFASLRADYGDLTGLPHLHEDSLLFAHVLRTLDGPRARVRKADAVIYHEVEGFNRVIRKAYYYGRDRGSHSGQGGGGAPQLRAPDRWLLERLDLYRWRPYVWPWVNVAGALYDGVRFPPFVAGYLRGSSGVREPANFP